MIKIKVRAGRLAEALTALMPVIPGKTNRDTLKNIKLTAEIKEGQDGLHLMASDLEIYAQMTIAGTDITVFKDGKILVPAQAFLDFIKSFGSNDLLNIEHTENSAVLKIECEGSEFEIGVQDLDEYPNFPQIPANAEKFDLTAEGFSHLLSKTEFATAEKNSPRLELTAICINCSQDNVSMMATDTHRIAIASNKLKTPVKEDRQLLVSPRALSQIAKMATVGDVQLLISESTLFVSGEFSCISAQLMDAKFPSVKELIPNYSKKIKLKTNEFITQLKKVALAADNKNTVRFKIKENTITLSAKSREQSKSAVAKYVCEYAGDPLEVALDGKYLLDALKAAEAAEIEFHFEESDQSLFFTEPGFQYILAVQE